MKRVFVPTALHAELTEYTDLVRVLRTTRTLDLTSHLLQHAAGKGKEKDSDTWTSWPLIDCPVPEWSLQDEIQQLGETVLRERAQAVRARDGGEVNDHDELDQDSDSDLEGLSPTATKLLVLHTGSVLVHILNLMADQRPSAPGSMQNRLWAMNWEDVISLLAVGGVIDPTVVARAEKRLERIYGPSTSKAMERLNSVASAKARFSTFASIQEDQLLAPPILPRTRRNQPKGNSRPCFILRSETASPTLFAGRQSNKSGAKSRAVIDTDTDMDA
ncbi:hypothetical protein J3R83DRAFT_68 [Lanmaoa asiatica]|nr:hypothetical protein J3R83DRAFT_68 [Lanmaoa asiatica]